MNKDHRRLLITIGTGAAFFLFGFLDNLKGPAIPYLLSALKINYSSMANVLLMEYAGFFGITFISAILIARMGLKNVFLSALGLVFLGLALPSGFPLIYSLLVGYIMLGTGFGAIQCVVSNTIMICYDKNKGKIFNLINAFHGLGSMTVPVYAGALLSAAISWRVVYAIMLVPVLLLLIYLVTIKYPTCQKQKEAGMASLAKTAFCKEMVLHYGAMCFYEAVEIGLAAWIVDYLVKIKGQPIFYSSLALSCYFGLLTLGRLLGCLVVDKIGCRKMLLLAASGSLVCLSLGIYGPSSLVFLLPGTGFFFSIIFPTVVASFTEIKRPNIDKYLGFLFTAAGLGGILGPWLIGWCAELIKLSQSVSLLIVFNALMLSSIVMLNLSKFRAVVEKPVIIKLVGIREQWQNKLKKAS